MAGSQHLFNFFCDLETSGSCPIRNGVISATLLVCDHDLNVVDEFCSNVCPPDLKPATWSLGAEGVHGKSIAEVSNYKPNDQFCYELLCFLAKYKHPGNFPQPFICHASPRGMLNFHPVTRKPLGGYQIYPWFDYFFLEWCFRKAKFQNGEDMSWTFWKIFTEKNLISTVQMGRDSKYRKNDLRTWADRIGFKLNHHDDRSDVYCCLEIYKYLTNLKAGNFVHS